MPHISLRIDGDLPESHWMIWGIMKRRVNVKHRKTNRTLLVCVDGGSWNVINPLIKANKMPHIAKLVNEGVSGELKSIEPILSPAIWTSIATGKTPEKHGIKNFFTLQDSLKAKRIWEIFEDYRRSVGVMGYFATHPPRVRNGFMVPGFFDPGIETIPENLSFFRELLVATDRGRNAKPLQMTKYAWKAMMNGCKTSTIWNAGCHYLWKRFKKPELLDSYYKEQNIYLKFARDLFISCLKKFDPDLSILYFWGTDPVSHRYWQFYEPQYFTDINKNEDIRRYKDVIPNCYILLDHTIGQILKSFDKEDTIFIVSDHGFKRLENYGHFYKIDAEALLEKIGLLEEFIYTLPGRSVVLHTRRDSPFSEKKRLFDRVRGILDSARLSKSGEKVFEVAQERDYLSFVPTSKCNLLSSVDELISIEGVPSFRVTEITKETFMWTGGHDINGIFIANGPEIKCREQIRNASIFDITPTILALNGFPIARDMDGKVLTQMMEPSFLDKMNLQYIDTYGVGVESKEGAEMLSTIEEDGELKKRLEDLGYL